MNNFVNRLISGLLMLSLFCVVGCTSGDGSGGGKDGKSSSKEYEDRVVVHNLSDPDGLHPTNSTGAASTNIRKYFLQKLLSIDNNSLELEPWMAVNMPTMEETEKGMIITYELRDDMTWDDGKKITPRDVEFSIMCIKNPKVDAPHLRPYYGFIKDFKYDKDNPMKFQLICDEKFMLWDHSTGNDGFVFPEHIYDPNGYMKDFKIADFADENSSAVKSQENIKFSQDYNSTKFHREILSGSGPYKFIEWQTNQRIIFEKKENWWAKDIVSDNMYFDVGPQKVIYETVNDRTTALTALKAEKLDVIKQLRSNDWVKLPDSEKFNKNYNRSNPDFLTYSYIGLHVKNPVLRGKKTRKALAHLVDADRINKSIFYNLNTRIVGPISPLRKDEYNSGIKGYTFNPDKAKQLLAEDGWSDSDGDGILDKVIDGRKRPLKINFLYNQGNNERKAVGLAIQDAVKRVGIDMQVNSLEWSVFLQRLKEHKVDMWYGAWVFDPRPSDPKQIWHSDSYTSGGSNYTGFGNPASDDLIKKIRGELDPGKRAQLYQKWQELLHEEVPYIFLYTTKRRNAIHKRFTNINEGARDPGFYAGGFQYGKGASAIHN